MNTYKRVLMKGLIIHINVVPYAFVGSAAICLYETKNHEPKNISDYGYTIFTFAAAMAALWPVTGVAFIKSVYENESVMYTVHKMCRSSKHT